MACLDSTETFEKFFPCEICYERNCVDADRPFSVHRRRQTRVCVRRLPCRERFRAYRLARPQLAAFWKCQETREASANRGVKVGLVGRLSKTAQDAFPRGMSLGPRQLKTRS